MTDLHDLLDRGAQSFRPSPDGWGELQKRVHVRHRRRRQASGLTAAVIAIAATGFLLRAFNPPIPQVPISTPSAVPERLQAQVTDQIDVGPFPQAIAVGEGGVWVDVPANAPEASPEIVRIDPNSDSVVARIPVPEGESDIAAGEGSVWVTRDSRTQGGQLVLQTLQIDPATDTIIATLPEVGGQVAVGDGYLWALAAGSGDRPTTTVLVKIDPETGSVISREPLGATITDIVIGGGSVWLPTLPDPESGTLIQVDAGTNQILRTLRLPFHDAPVFADGMLWVPTCCSNNIVSLVPVDPATGETVGDSVDVGDGLPFAHAFGHLLLMSERGALSDLNTTSGIVEALAESDWLAAHGTTVFDPVSGSVWVSNYRRTVTRIDLSPLADVSSAPVFFPTSRSGPTGMAALYEGTLIERDGCIFMGGGDQVSLPIWPQGYTIDRNQSGAFQIHAGDGSTVAVVGQPMSMGGGFIAEFFPTDKVEPRDAQLASVNEHLGEPIPQQCLVSNLYGVWLVGVIDVPS